MPEEVISQIAQIANLGTSTSNMYININAQGTGTLTGSNVDANLVKADRLLEFKESISRKINRASANDLFASGELDASLVAFEMLRTKASIYVENSVIQGTQLDTIKVYWSILVGAKLNVLREIDYSSCFITEFSLQDKSVEGERLDTIKGLFRYTQRKETQFYFDQTGKPMGQDVSLVDFTKGTLQAS